MITVRLKPHDVLSLMHQELVAQGRLLKPWFCDERQTWTYASRDLLKAVEDPDQKMAWAIQLARAFAPSTGGVTLQLLVGMLLEGER